MAYLAKGLLLGLQAGGVAAGFMLVVFGAVCIIALLVTLLTILIGGKND